MKIVVSIVVMIGLIVLGGIGVSEYKQVTEKQKIMELLKGDEAVELYRKQLKIIDKRAFEKDGVIKSYTLDEKNISYNPMGGVDIDLIINENPSFTVGLNVVKVNEDKLALSGGVIVSTKLDDALTEKTHD